ncbi:uncharacterized protein LOC128204443 [Mya arenaria]|uniref:uncharacterized protein LOC128204443 n=1 Tax=Mya arenaria TaxID=6604 RepID=UPI0022E2CA40|nr:uncharacterized protein LOC128204443 [Mya arenaria]
MSLPFLTAEHTRAAVETLKDIATESGHEALQTFMSYVKVDWFERQVRRLENRSAFKETVRTNNELEGWHRRINGKIGAPLYVLIPLLHSEAGTVDVKVKLLSEQSLTRYQRATYKTAHGRLHKSWEDYEDGDMTKSKLLREVSFIAGFAPITERQTAPIVD